RNRRAGDAGFRYRTDRGRDHGPRTADWIANDRLLYNSQAGTRSEAVIKALGYIRVSTDEQVASGAGLDAQRAVILAEAKRRGWPVEVVSEPKGASSATLQRPGLSAVLDQLDRGEAQVLIVAKLDRLSRSVTQGSQIIERAGR